jgi:hypothetical protein
VTLALVAVAFVSAACSSGGRETPAPRAAGEPAGLPTGARGTGPATPVTGMDGRPPFDAAGSPSPLPPGWVTGNAGPGPSGPPAAIVPDVRGLVFERAVQRLWDAGIDFGLVVARASDSTLWSVLEQHPLHGSDTPDSGRIDLVLSMRVAEGAERQPLRQCDPTAANLADPYCRGKRLQYFE